MKLLFKHCIFSHHHRFLRRLRLRQEEVNEEPFDVTLINPEDYLKIDSPNHEDNEDESETTEKPSRPQRKRIRKKMLKEEAARRKKLIGPQVPAEMSQTPFDKSVTDVDGINLENEASCFQSVRPIAQEKEDELGGNDKTRKEEKKCEESSQRVLNIQFRF